MTGTNLYGAYGGVQSDSSQGYAAAAAPAGEITALLSVLSILVR